MLNPKYILIAVISLAGSVIIVAETAPAWPPKDDPSARA